MAGRDDGAGHGAKLSRYLEKVWEHQSTTRGAWCREHRIPDSTVLRWGIGVEPDMRNYRAVAEALGFTLVQVLEIAGEIPPQEKGKAREPAPPEPTHVCRVADALAQDNTLRPEWRAGIKAMLDLELKDNPHQKRRRGVVAQLDEDDPPTRAAGGRRR
jgi:hypothetical protein